MVHSFALIWLAVYCCIQKVKPFASSLYRTRYADILSPSISMHSFKAIDCPWQLSVLHQVSELLFPDILGLPGYKDVRNTSEVSAAIPRNHISNTDYSMQELW